MKCDKKLFAGGFDTKKKKKKTGKVLAIIESPLIQQARWLASTKLKKKKGKDVERLESLRNLSSIYILFCILTILYI